jgi:hypothetical protein
MLIMLILQPIQQSPVLLQRNCLILRNNAAGISLLLITLLLHFVRISINDLLMFQLKC